jgi:hypothetical protein
MPVTDEQAASLRALLARQPDEHLRLFNLLDQNSRKTGYQALVSAAFMTAVERRFARDVSPAEVIEFVGQVRSRSLHFADRVDPVIAERVIMAVLADDSLDDIDPYKSLEAQSTLLAALVYDEDLDDAGLDAFLAKAREVADEWLA